MVVIKFKLINQVSPNSGRILLNLCLMFLLMKKFKKKKIKNKMGIMTN